ncbi:unnamed protein product [Lampetra fluviatilis]
MPAREMLRRALRTARSTLRNARGVRFVTLRPIAKEERAQGRGLTAMSGQSPDFAIPRHVAHEPWELCAQIATANVRGREASKLEIEVVGRPEGVRPPTPDRRAPTPGAVMSPGARDGIGNGDEKRTSISAPRPPPASSAWRSLGDAERRGALISAERRHILATRSVHQPRQSTR